MLAYYCHKMMHWMVEMDNFSLSIVVGPTSFGACSACLEEVSKLNIIFNLFDPLSAKLTLVPPNMPKE